MAKVLIVEDSDTNLEILVRWLLRRGFEVHSARNGAECLALVEQTPPDLILMDMNMPVMSGLEATQRLKGSEATRQIPIIALSARAMSHEQRQSMEAGCDAFISKPADFKLLTQTLQKLLGDKMPAAAIRPPATSLS